MKVISNPNPVIRKNRAACLKTQYALNHHAQALMPIFQAFQNALDWSGLLHTIQSERGGANSNFLYLQDGRKFILRGRMHNGLKPFIEIRDYQTGQETKLYTDRDAIRFVEAL
jgi:hypothetical protein